uniref:Uncharacterized protein n=1 Tax=Arundo donax TaxID=35708 RepID=A0A0A8Z3H7_ARUDO
MYLIWIAFSHYVILAMTSMTFARVGLVASD